MPRTTLKLVQDILGGTNPNSNWDGATDLTPYIFSASTLVDQIVNIAGNYSPPVIMSGLQSATSLPIGSDTANTQLELIERWLAAHCYTRFDPLYSSKSNLGASGSFQDQGGLALDASRYGQMAQNLDISGALVAIGKRQFARGMWLGKPLSQQVPWNQRN